MMMMAMMTNTIPYRRKKNHVWDKVLKGIWVHPSLITIIIIITIITITIIMIITIFVIITILVTIIMIITTRRQLPGFSKYFHQLAESPDENTRNPWWKSFMLFVFVFDFVIVSGIAFVFFIV